MRIVLLLLCSALGLHAQAALESLLLLNSSPAAQVFIITEGFEETDSGGAAGSGTDGYDSPDAGAETGTPNNDYATAPAPFIGSFSLLLDAATTTQAARWTNVAASEMYYYFQWVGNGINPSATTEFFQVQTNTTEVVGIFIRTDGTIRAFSGTTQSASTVSTVSSGTLYHFWVHFKTDGLGVGTADVGFSTTGTRPTSGNGFTSVTGIGTNMVNRLQCLATTTGGARTNIVDHLLVSETPIGSNP